MAESFLMAVTTDQIEGYQVVETKGEVFGLIVRSRGILGNFMAGLRTIFGGEITEYTEMLEEARTHAMERMIKAATDKGANAVVRMQFDSSELAKSMTEIVAYGTAVVVKKK